MEILSSSLLRPHRPGAADARADAHAWRGEAVGLDLNTWIVNPSTGYIVNWNNAPARQWRTGDTLEMWGSVHRVQLLDHFVQQRLENLQAKLDTKFEKLQTRLNEKFAEQRERHGCPPAE